MDYKKKYLKYKKKYFELKKEIDSSKNEVDNNEYIYIGKIHNYFKNIDVYEFVIDKELDYKLKIKNGDKLLLKKNKGKLKSIVEIFNIQMFHQDINQIDKYSGYVGLILKFKNIKDIKDQARFNNSHVFLIK